MDKASRALLDTHVWLWYLLGDSRLTDRQKQTIEKEGGELWLSPVSVWEAHLLIERGRLPVLESPTRWIEKAMEILPVREASMSFPIALRSRGIVLTHEDPADRFIVATALEMRMSLLTSDRRLLECGEVKCIC